MSTKEEQKQHLIDLMKGDEELGLYEHGQEVGHEVQVERMYSEEQVLEIMKFARTMTSENTYKAFDRLFKKQ